MILKKDTKDSKDTKLFKLFIISPIEQYLIDQANVIADSLEHEIEVVEQYDNILNNLYEWADTVMPHGKDVRFSNIPKLCWIKTT